MANEIRLRSNSQGGKVDAGKAAGTIVIPAADTTVTDAAITSGSATLTSATAAFDTAMDVGAPVDGPAGIPAGTYIASVTNSTTVTLSANATATATAQTLNIRRTQDMQSPGLAAMPVVDASHHMALVLDPDGYYGSPEIVWVTLHLASATWAQIVRTPPGEDTQTARTHYQDEDWVHGGTDRDAGPGYSTVYVVAASGTAQTLPDPSVYPLQDITLTGNCTLTFPAAPIPGKRFLLVLRQDGTGSRTVTWDAAVHWPAGTAPTLTTTASKADVFEFFSTAAGYWFGYVRGQNY